MISKYLKVQAEYTLVDVWGILHDVTWECSVAEGYRAAVFRRGAGLLNGWDVSATEGVI